MKRRLATLLLILYISAIVPISEWAKIPYLWDHYCEHKLADASMDFFDFINHHYGNCLKVYPDAEKDMKLPFKSDNQSSHTVFSVLPKEMHAFVVVDPLPSKINKTRFIFTNHFTSADEADTWQPPKLVS
ncbi:MAG: hypothetical protein IPH36_10675 [Saprospiraceae bacterium]|nr:hypothetical protein [Saprospiraceae bacterium]MBK8110529.1 hypothetical protein [Saprospiraceae bacterium]